MRNLLMLTITMALATVCVSAQRRDDKVTFSDFRNQSITVSSFGTVLKFIDRNGNEIVPEHTFRICSCNNWSPCFESKDPTKEATATLLVLFPVKSKKARSRVLKLPWLGGGPVLKPGQSLQLQATIALEDRTVMRRLVWSAGSREVQIQTLTWSGSPVCCINEQSLALRDISHHGCNAPPPEGGYGFICPPPPSLFLKAPRDSSQHTARFTLSF